MTGEEVKNEIALKLCVGISLNKKFPELIPAGIPTKLFKISKENGIPYERILSLAEEIIEDMWKLAFQQMRQDYKERVHQGINPAVCT